MGGRWVVLVVPLGAAFWLLVVAAPQDYDVTRPEDVIAEYEFDKFKSIFVNTSQHLLQAISRLEASAAKNSGLTELKKTVLDIYDSLASVSEQTRNVRESVNNGADATRTELRVFKDQILGKLSAVQLFVEHKTSVIENQVSLFAICLL